MKNIPYATQWIGENELKAVACALKSDYLTQGPLVAVFEKKVAKYCGAKYAVAVNSGTSALHAACFAAGVKPGDEVITSPVTFVASANCVLYCGGKPVFADILKDTVNIDVERIREKISPRTKAVIPVHFAGQPADMREIHKLASKHTLIIIEDACHALGAEYKGTKIGACKYSDMTVFSFHAVKQVTTGEGGIVLTNDEKFFQRLLMFRTHGITRDKNLLKDKDQGAWYYEMQDLGFNNRITDFQCAMGIEQLNRLGKFIARRREIVKKYNEAFGGIRGLILPVEKCTGRSSWHLYVIRVNKNRKEIFDYLRSKGIGANVHYLPIYKHPYYQKMGYKTEGCPMAEAYYERAITLPLFPKMTGQEVKYVIDSVREAVERTSRPKVGIIVQARMGSTRLPGKVMLPLLKRPVLQRVVERLSASRTADELIIATTKKKADASIVSLANKLGVKCYRGSEMNVLSRYYGAAKKHKIDIVVRVTSDCPLIDSEILDRMVDRFIKLNEGKSKCDYLSNTIVRTFPRGLDIEIFLFKVLEKAQKEAKNKIHKEHVTPYINQNPHWFRLNNYRDASNKSHLRWTLDEQSDYALIRQIYQRLGKNHVTSRYADILTLFEQDPALARINSHVEQKKT